MAFDTGFDYGFQGVAQAVDVPLAKLEIAALRARPIAANQPLVGLSDRFLLIGQRFDMDRRRITLVAEQVLYSPAAVVALVFSERWTPDVEDPGTLIFSEPWNAEIGEPDTLEFQERWED